MFLSCHSNYKNIARIAHSHCKKITRKSILERTLDYDEFLTRASRSNTGTDSIEEWTKTTSEMLRCAHRTHLSHSRPVLLTAPFANTFDRVFTTSQDLSVETEWWTCLLNAANEHLPPLSHLDMYVLFLHLRNE